MDASTSDVTHRTGYKKLDELLMTTRLWLGSTP
jgi:hypothetical protein